MDDGITPAGAGKTILITAPKTVWRDHPRRCGENLATLGIFSAGCGSPPQVRGKLALDAVS